MQIFFPSNIQIFPDTFPGQSINDCPTDISRDKAEEIECANWRWPDKYGHYRVAKFTQIKHHWWWKVRFSHPAQIEMIFVYSDELRMGRSAAIASL